jgi:hypothetical protein
VPEQDAADALAAGAAGSQDQDDIGAMNGDGVAPKPVRRELWRSGDQGLAADYDYVMFGKVSLHAIGMQWMSARRQKTVRSAGGNSVRGMQALRPWAAVSRSRLHEHGAARHLLSFRPAGMAKQRCQGHAAIQWLQGWAKAAN